MKRRLVDFTPRAESNLLSIFGYIAKKSTPRIAAGYVASIREHCNTLGLSPFRGQADKRKPHLRVVGFDHSATIAFRVLPEVVLIHSIHYRGRNVTARL